MTKLEYNLSKFLQEIDSNKIQLYLFGSYLMQEKFEDIDILIIYENYELVRKVKKEINDRFAKFHPHIICISNKEEEELKFVQQTNALKIILK